CLFPISVISANQRSNVLSAWFFRSPDGPITRSPDSYQSPLAPPPPELPPPKPPKSLPPPNPPPPPQLLSDPPPNPPTHQPPPPPPLLEKSIRSRNGPRKNNRKKISFML